MNKLLVLCIGVLLFASCEQDSIIPEIEETSVDQTTLAKKVDVCHKGQVINVSINAAATTNGGGIFSTYLYWSSTEVTNYYAARQFFFNGNQFKYHKGDTSYVRAVRAF